MEAEPPGIWWRWRRGITRSHTRLLLGKLGLYTCKGMLCPGKCRECKSVYIHAYTHALYVQTAFTFLEPPSPHRSEAYQHYRASMTAWSLVFLLMLHTMTFHGLEFAWIKKKWRTNSFHTSLKLLCSYLSWVSFNLHLWSDFTLWSKRHSHPHPSFSPICNFSLCCFSCLLNLCPSPSLSF